MAPPSTPPPLQQQPQRNGMVITGPPPSSSSSVTHHRTLTKSRHPLPPATPPKQVQQRPTPPVSPEVPARDKSPSQIVTPRTPTVISNEEFESAERRVAIPLDDDPFARTEGVRMLKPTGLGAREDPPSSSSLSSSSLPLESEARPTVLSDERDESPKESQAQTVSLVNSDETTNYDDEQGDTSSSDNDNVTHANESMTMAEPEVMNPATAMASSPLTRALQNGHDGPGASNPNVYMNSLTGFRSPLFRTGRAPLLRVFIPSPEGDWLSDASVLECEAELRRAGLLPDKDKRGSENKGINLLRLGDVVWDMAVGDDGNAGRMVWDGSYLIDLDYTYSPIGDLPKYIPGFAFPPSYFHRIIRTASSNPVIRLDIRPWGAQVASNLQLLQERARTETPQGSFHNVVRWVHRSSFNIRPPTMRSQSRGRTSVDSHSPVQSRIPIPNTTLFVDPGWIDVGLGKGGSKNGLENNERTKSSRRNMDSSC
ncbi:hypothetical protein LENED_001561 [Lentinula edodes]|uniref:Uncharacterized protein n=1 Tax=Lentinula edodes TaxID=5353 RepID=A0A1Q3DZ78_LENED|nr:hypothetical protein LENED_001561 [Lentinula edodes]